MDRSALHVTCGDALMGLLWAAAHLDDQAAYLDDQDVRARGRDRHLAAHEPRAEVHP